MTMRASLIAILLSVTSASAASVSCTDSSTDTPAIQAAIAATTRGEVRLSGVCRLDQNVTLKTVTALAGEHGAVIRRVDGAKIIIGGEATQQYKIQVRNLWIVNDSIKDTAPVIEIDRANDVKLDDLLISQPSGRTISIGTPANPTGATNIWISRVSINLSSLTGGSGVYIYGGGGVFARETYVQGCIGCQQVGFWIENPSGTTFDTFNGLSIGTGEVDYGFAVNGAGAAYNIQLTGGGFDRAGGAAIYLAPAGSGAIASTWFNGIYATGVGTLYLGLGPSPVVNIVASSGTSIGAVSFVGGVVAGSRGPGFNIMGQTGGTLAHVMVSNVQIFDGSWASPGSYKAINAGGTLADFVQTGNQIWNDTGSSWAP